jgi:MYXO-CTERM domain-containing protein
MTRTLTLSTLGAALFLTAGVARANDTDRAACEAASEGDACVRHTGDAGTCVPDESDPSVLTCEDGPDDGATSGGTDDNGGTDDSGGTDDNGGDDGDDAACVGLQEGEACVRADGSDGSCVPDVSGDGSLECEDGPDDGATSGSDDNGGGADDGDDAACVGLVEGEACVRADGSDGTCVPDVSDDGSLECEDGPGGADDNGGGGVDDNGGNQIACDALDLGDDCTRVDGSAGTCVADDSDPGMLECEDEATAVMSGASEDASASGDSLNISCSVAPTRAPSAMLGFLVLAGLIRRRRA